MVYLFSQSVNQSVGHLFKQSINSNLDCQKISNLVNQSVSQCWVESSPSIVHDNHGTVLHSIPSLLKQQAFHACV